MSSTTNQLPTASTQPDPRWKGILECAATEVFSMMAGATLVSFPEEPQEAHGDRTAMVGLAGVICGMITIRCTSRVAAKLAGHMLGTDAEGLSATEIGDAMGELCNMVGGNFKSKITDLANGCMLSVPTVITGEDYVVQTVPPHEGFQIPLSLDGEPVWFTLVIHT